VIREFYAYHAGFAGGVFVAAGDFNGDGRADIVTAAGAGGGPHVKVFDGATGAVLGSFFAYSANFAGGVHVAVGDLDGIGPAEIITGAGPGGGPHVRVFRHQGTPHPSFSDRFVYHAGFAGGVYVAAGDVDGDGRAEIITGAGPGGGPHVRVFDQSWNLVSEFYAYAANFQGGVRVGAMDINGDNRREVITAAGPGGGPHVRAISIPLQERAGYYVFHPAFSGGVFAAGEASAPGSGFSFSQPTPLASLDRAFVDLVDDELLASSTAEDIALLLSPVAQSADVAGLLGMLSL
jgi:hypothetical protein